MEKWQGDEDQSLTMTLGEVDPGLGLGGLLGGSGVVISGVISPLIWLISIVTLLITLLITTHEPPSRDQAWGLRV